MDQNHAVNVATAVPIAVRLFVSGQSVYRCSVKKPPFDLAVVVDDDPDIVLAARVALRDLFNRFETLPNPAELPAFIKTHSPDVILLDLNFERGATDGREGLDCLANAWTSLRPRIDATNVEQ